MGRSSPLIDNEAAAVSKIAQWRYRPNLVQYPILNKEPRSLVQFDRGSVYARYYVLDALPSDSL